MFCQCSLQVAVRRGTPPRFKRQVGCETEDQNSASGSAAAKHASCCRCAKRRPGIRDRGRPLPSSRPLVHSLRDHTTRSRLADGEAGKIPCLGFYGDRICGTSRSDQSELSNRQFVFPPGAGLGCFCSLICPPVGATAEISALASARYPYGRPAILCFLADCYTVVWNPACLSPLHRCRSIRCQLIQP